MLKRDTSRSHRINRSEARPTGLRGLIGTGSGILDVRFRLRVDTVVLVLVSLVVGFVIGPRLPNRFQADAEVLRNLLDSAIFTPLGSSFSNASAAYSFFGFSTETPLHLATSFNLALWLIVAVFAIPRNGPAGYSIRTLVALGLAVAGGIYLAAFTKEIFAVATIGAVMLAWRRAKHSRWADLLSLGALAAYGVFFRTYWLLIAFTVAVFVVARSLRLRAVPTLILLGLSMAAGYVGGVIFRGSPVADLREDLNYSERLQTTESLIDNVIVSGHPLADLANTIFVWLHSLFPVGPLFSGGATQILFAVFQLLITFRLLAYLRVAWRHRLQANRLSRELYFCVAFTIAFTLIQALFEPDFGSLSRHRLGIYVLALRSEYLLWTLRRVTRSYRPLKNVLSRR